MSKRQCATGGLSAAVSGRGILASDRAVLPADQGHQFEGKAAESLKNESLRYPMFPATCPLQPVPYPAVALDMTLIRAYM